MPSSCSRVHHPRASVSSAGLPGSGDPSRAPTPGADNGSGTVARGRHRAVGRRRDARHQRERDGHPRDHAHRAAPVRAQGPASSTPMPRPLATILKTVTSRGIAIVPAEDEPPSRPHPEDRQRRRSRRRRKSPRSSPYPNRVPRRAEAPALSCQCESMPRSLTRLSCIRSVTPVAGRNRIFRLTGSRDASGLCEHATSRMPLSAPQWRIEQF